MAKTKTDEFGNTYFLFDAGQPTKYEDALADEICLRLSQGETLIRICESEHMPPPAVVYGWLDTHPAFLNAYRIAREKSADSEADMIRKIAEEAGGENAVEVQRRRLIIQTMQWRAARMRPSKWGKKVEVSSTEGGFKDWTELAEKAQQETPKETEVEDDGAEDDA